MLNPKNWKQTTLGEVAEIVGGGTPSTKESSYWEGDIPWITPKDLSNNNSIWIERGGKSITQIGFKSSSARMLPVYSILFSSRAPIGYIAINKVPVTTNQGFKSLIPKGTADYRFLYYWLMSNKNSIERQASGSTFAEVSGSVMKRIPILLPPLPEQKSIAAVLSSLDDKIELLRGQNKMLEEMAQRLFKEWFVDFNFPNEDGKPYKKSGGRMVESEMGEIPEGWRVVTIDDVTDVVTKGTTPTTIGGSFADSGINFIKAESITADKSFNRSKFSYIGKQTNDLLERSKLKVGDLLFTIAGTIGRFAVVTESELPANTNQAVAIIRVGSLINPYFLRCVMDQKEFVSELLGGVVESVQANLSLTNIKLARFVVPINDLESLFLPIAHIFEKQNRNKQEIYSLSAIRDALLPKLMSGDVEIKV